MEYNDRISKAQESIMNKTCVEYVTRVYESPDYVEIHGVAGGDDICYRIYNNGRICER